MANDRFWKKAAVSDAESCWPWQAGIDRRGYGRFNFAGKSDRAHRVALILAGKSPPHAGSSALHSCDNPACVNPAHLRWGTQADNMKDRASRGRTGQSKLTEDDVAAIRASGLTQRELAIAYGVTQSAISLIKRGTNWRYSIGP